MSPLNNEVILPWIFPHFDSLLSNEPLQSLLDRYCKDACDLTGFTKAVAVSIATNAEAVGISNIQENLRKAILENLQYSGSASDMNPPEALVKQYQMNNNYISFIPEESNSPLPKTILSKDFIARGTWKPKDALYLLLYSENGEYLGNLRLADPSDYNRPNFNDPETIQIFNEIAIVGGRLIDYYLRWQRLRGSELLYMYAFDQTSNFIMLINDKGQFLRANYAFNEFCQNHHTKTSDLIKLIKAQNSKQWEYLIKNAESVHLTLTFKPLGAKSKLEFDIVAKPLIPNTNYASILELKLVSDENKESKPLEKTKSEKKTKAEESEVETFEKSLEETSFESEIEEKRHTAENNASSALPQKQQSELTSEQMDILMEISGNIAQHLSIVSGNVELMKMDEKNETHLKIMDIILVAVDRINQQLQKIRDLDKIHNKPEIVQHPRKSKQIKPKGVLCVEDEPQILELLSAIVKQCNEEVITAENGKEAWEYISQGNLPKLVISDVRMPFMSGFELLRNIRNSELNIPVILISGFWSEDTIQEAKKLGVVDFMPKPFPVAKLIQHINSITRS
ncbi:MAG: response regulator [bacterium]|nr:response regulator [bacterium]